MYNRKILCVCCICTLLLLGGCGASDASSGTADQATGDGSEIQEQSDAYDLSKNDAYEVTLDCDGTKPTICEQSFVTNSTEIHVSAESSENMTVYLYAADDTSESLMEKSLDGKSDITFTNLTSAQTYAVGVQADKEATAELTVTD